MSNTLKQAITSLKGKIADAYTAISNKGGTLPATQDSSNLANAITSIPSGGGGYTLQDFIDDGGKLSRSELTQETRDALGELDFSNVPDMSYMFQYANFGGSIKLIANNTTPQSLAYMFANLAGTADFVDLSDFHFIAKPINHLFNSSAGVKKIDATGIDTSQSTTFQNCFNNTPLTWLDITGWDFSAATNVTSTFRLMNYCETLIGDHTIADVTRADNPIATCIGLNINMTITNCPELNRASLRAIINGLADRTGQAQRTLTIGTLSSKLTTEDTTIANNKNWTIA